MKGFKKFLHKFAKLDLFSWIMFLVVTVWVCSMLFVLYTAIINSLKGAMEIKYSFNTPNSIFKFPTLDGSPLHGLHFEYYINIFRPVIHGVTDVKKNDAVNDVYNYFYGLASGRRVYIYELFFNSLFFSVIMTLFTMATQVMVAYAVAKYDFKLKNWYYRVAIIVMLIPIVGSLASELAFAEFFGFNNSTLGVSFMRAKYPGVYFLVFYATFRSVSSTYMEAAELDGAGHLQIFFQIMLPLVKSSLFAVFILLFIQNWNDYYTPMIFLKEKPVMTYALFNLQSDGQLEINRKFAACVASAIPIVILFIVFRNKIMGNVTMGGIKG